MSIVERTCPSCGHHIKDHQGGTIMKELLGLPEGVKFDPSDQELALEAKVGSDIQKLHPLIDDFIPTLESQNGIYSSPQTPRLMTVMYWVKWTGINDQKDYKG